MDKKTYAKKFSGAIKWRVSQPEANEILEDYHEIFSEYHDDSLLVKNLGSPIDAAKALTVPKQYRNWLIMFTLMSACIIIPELLLLRMTFYQTPLFATGFFFLLGVLSSLIWFRPKTERKIKRTKDIFIILAVMLILNICCLVFFYGLVTQQIKLLPKELYGVMAHRAFQLLATAAAAIGIVALVKARTQNIRWKAVYIISHIIILESVLVIGFLLSTDIFVSFWQMSSVYIIALGSIGFIGVILSLC